LFTSPHRKLSRERTRISDGDVEKSEESTKILANEEREQTEKKRVIEKGRKKGRGDKKEVHYPTTKQYNMTLNIFYTL